MYPVSCCRAPGDVGQEEEMSYIRKPKTEILPDGYELGDVEYCENCVYCSGSEEGSAICDFFGVITEYWHQLECWEMGKDSPKRHKEKTHQGDGEAYQDYLAQNSL